MSTEAAADRKVWLIEEDGTHTPGVLVKIRHIMPDFCQVQVEGEQFPRLWNRRNVIDHESVERLSALVA